VIEQAVPGRICDLFSTFTDGWSGVGLLCLRLVAADGRKRIDVRRG